MASAEGEFLKKDKENIKLKAKSADDPVTLHCPKCGGFVFENADICESCGEWLLEGKCKFCYADVEEGQKFCSECGNNPEGVLCPSCNEWGHFDFCKNCKIPLTEKAKEMLDAFQNSVEIQELSTMTQEEESLTELNPYENEDIDENTSIEINEETSEKKESFDNLKSYLEKFEAQNASENTSKPQTPASLETPTKKTVLEPNPSSQSKREPVDFGKLIANNRKESLSKTLKLIEKSKIKVFSNNQESRSFHEALQSSLAPFIKNLTCLGWLCNAYDNIHCDPEECAKPEDGGVWLYE